MSALHHGTTPNNRTHARMMMSACDHRTAQTTAHTHTHSYVTQDAADLFCKSVGYTKAVRFEKREWSCRCRWAPFLDPRPRGVFAVYEAMECISALLHTSLCSLSPPAHDGLIVSTHQLTSSIDPISPPHNIDPSITELTSSTFVRKGPFLCEKRFDPISPPHNRGRHH